MLKFRISHGISNDETYLVVTYNYQCGDRIDCKHCNECKYGNTNTVLDKILRKLSNKFIYFIREYALFSGTYMCPFHMSKNYTCYQCKYVCGELLRDCYCPERLNDIRKNRLKDRIISDDWHPVIGQCAYFEKSESADSYKDIKYD